MTISPAALKIVELSAVDVPITTEEILADLFYPAPPAALTAARDDEESRGKRR